MTGPSPFAEGDPPPAHAAAQVAANVHQALRTVIDPCCRDRDISVVDMGLVQDVSVAADGRARIEVLLTSGWCPFQVDLTAEIGAAAESVPGVSAADVEITLRQVWSPERMSPSARRKLRLLPVPAAVPSRAAYFAVNPDPMPIDAEEDVRP